MGNERKSRTEEAALSLLMDKHAQQQGEQLWQEYERAVRMGKTQPVPETVERSCKAQIENAFEYTDGTKRKRGLFGTVSRVAACVLLLVTLITTTLSAANADSDIHVDRFLQHACSLSEMQNRYVIHLRRYPASEVQNVEAIRGIMAELTHKGYTLQQEYTNHNATPERGAMGLYSIYRNEQGQKVELNCRMPISGLIVIHKEEGLYASQIQCVGYDMVLVEQGSLRKIFWLDDAEGLCYSLYVDGLSESDFWNLVYALAQA